MRGMRRRRCTTRSGRNRARRKTPCTPCGLPGRGSHAVVELCKPAWDILEDVHGAVVEVHALDCFVGEADCDVVCAHSVCLLRDQANKGCALNVGAHEEVLSGLERASGFDDEAGVGAQFRVELFVAFVRWAYGEVCHAGPLSGRTVSRGCVRLNGLCSARVYAFAVRVVRSAQVSRIFRLSSFCWLNPPSSLRVQWVQKERVQRRSSRAGRVTTRCGAFGGVLSRRSRPREGMWACLEQQKRRRGVA